MYRFGLRLLGQTHQSPLCPLGFGGYFRPSPPAVLRLPHAASACIPSPQFLATATAFQAAPPRTKSADPAQCPSCDGRRPAGMRAGRAGGIGRTPCATHGALDKDSQRGRRRARRRVAGRAAKVAPRAAAAGVAAGAIRQRLRRLQLRRRRRRRRLGGLRGCSSSDSRRRRAQKCATAHGNPACVHVYVRERGHMRIGARQDVFASWAPCDEVRRHVWERHHEGREWIRELESVDHGPHRVEHPPCRRSPQERAVTPHASQCPDTPYLKRTGKRGTCPKKGGPKSSL